MSEGIETTADDRAGLTRRALIGLGGAMVLTLSGGGIAAASRPSPGMPQQIWRRSTYATLVGSTFAVRGSTARLRLIATNDLPHRPAGHDDAFGLVFSGPDDDELTAGVPTLSHPRLGSFSMLLSPDPTLSSRRRYFAVVDRTL